MGIKSLEQRKRQQTLLIIGAVIIIIAAAILYFGFWQEGKGGEEILSGENKQSKENIILEEKLKKIDLDFVFLNEKILSFLKSHGDLPVIKGETGRSNPFIPY